MPSQLFALCIGIDEYAHPEIDSLQGCAKDISSLQDVMLMRYPDAQILGLINQAATRKNILDSFNTHLLENDHISMGDPILIYFACHGQRFTGEHRNVDALIPYDYAPAVPPIFDATLHELLNLLVQTKGHNVTLILDCCFSPVFAFSNVRRIQRLSWTSQLVEFHHETTLAEYRGFFNNEQLYVLISASDKDQHCNDSPTGGFFTQDIVSAMRSSWPLSCRELAVLGQRWGQSTLGQVSVCYGPCLDRLLCVLPKMVPIAKLRVYSSNVDLRGASADSLSLVSRREDANVVVHTANQTEANIQRLDRPTAQYGTRLVPFTLARTPQVLNGIARFNHYLNLRPSNPSLKHSSVQSLFPWRQGDRQSISTEVYHFKNEDKDKSRAWISPNILHDGVVLLDDVPNDHVLGLKITNTTDQAMYPYVLHFDTDTYEISELYSPFRETTRMPPKLLQPHESLIFGRCPNIDAVAFCGAQSPLHIELDEGKTERTAEIIKIILASRPVAVSYMAQASPMTSGEDRAGNFEVHEEIPGVWRTETVTFAVPANFRNGGHLLSSSSTSPLGLWRRFKESMAYVFNILSGRSRD